MTALGQENGYTRCAGTTNAGNPCRSKPKNGSEFCLFHAEDHVESQSRGGQVSAVRRSVREGFREGAERIFDTLFRTIEKAVDAEVVYWSACPNCAHKVPTTYPDIRAQTHAIELLLDQGYGKPAITIREADAPVDMPWDGMTPEQRKQLLREATAELERRTAAGE